MAVWNLYIDVTGRRLVANKTTDTPAEVPPLVQGDTPTWRIWLLARSETYPLGTPFTPIAVADVSDMQVAVGTRVGNSSTYYTQQFVWTPSGDPNTPYWEAQVPLNTAAITALLSSQSSASAWLEVKFFNSGMPNTVLDLQVTIQAAVIKDAGVPVVPPGLTAASVEYVNASFLRREISGAVTWISPSGKKFAEWVDDDGQKHCDPIAS